MMCTVITITVLLVLNDYVNALSISRSNTSVLTNTDAMRHSLDVAVLDNIGKVALNMVQSIAASEDETVDINAVSEFVIALSKATALVLHPQIPQMEDIKAEIDFAKEQVQKDKAFLEEKITNLEQKLKLSEERSKILELRLNDTGSNITKLNDLSNERKVGFTAISTNSQQFQTGAILRFENVQVNQGNNYDPSLSVFTCPLTGLYMVSVTLTAYTTHTIQAYLLVDGTQKLQLYNVGGNSHHNYNTVSESGLVRCNAGSKFWVQSHGSGKLYGGMITMFTGYLYETVE